MTRKCVLVVEDQYLIRLMLVEGLTDAGFAVIEAQDGETALGLLKGTEVDLLITDIQMPGCTDGNAVGAYAKTRHPGMPVIYASGREDTLTNALSQEDVFVSKPFGAQQIVVLATKLLRRAGRAAALTSQAPCA